MTFMALSESDAGGQKTLLGLLDSAGSTLTGTAVVLASVGLATGGGVG